ncbi:MAG: c-type cytochrome [Steroidobacterales bacterium]
MHGRRVRNAAAAGLFAMACAGIMAGAPAPAPAQETTSSVVDGVYSVAQAARGAELFQQSCAACHGAALTGLGEAPALVGAQFIGDFNGLTVGDLFERIRTTMPLNNPGSLTRDAYAGVLAFVLKSNGYRAGQRDLYSRTEFLNTMRFEPPAAAAAN